MNKVFGFLAIFLYWRTILSASWRGAVALTDWRTFIRRVRGKSLVDAVFITNMRDPIDRDRYLGKWRPKCGHFNGPRYHLKGVIGRTRALDSVTGDLLTAHGRKQAKEQFVSAVEWAQKRGAQVILLAASTKRLFGDDGGSLKERFPDLVFTIGDNGTMSLLLRETVRAFDGAGLKPGSSQIAVIGPSGFLGSLMTGALLKRGYEVIGVSSNQANAKKAIRNFGIKVFQSFDLLGKVDAVVACTHSSAVRLTHENDNFIRNPNKKLLVIDVAEPANLTKDEYARCESVIVRQDAGNAYAPKLKYVLGAISYRMFRLTRGVTFGCFAEALSLASAIKRGNIQVKEADWFSVSSTNMEFVEKLFEEDGFTIPSPRCFGKSVKSFNLSIEERTKEQLGALSSRPYPSKF